MNYCFHYIPFGFLTRVDRIPGHPIFVGTFVVHSTETAFTFFNLDQLMAYTEIFLITSNKSFSYSVFGSDDNDISIGNFAFFKKVVQLDLSTNYLGDFDV